MLLKDWSCLTSTLKNTTTAGVFRYYYNDILCFVRHTATIQMNIEVLYDVYTKSKNEYTFCRKNKSNRKTEDLKSLHNKKCINFENYKNIKELKKTIGILYVKVISYHCPNISTDSYRFM